MRTSSGAPSAANHTADTRGVRTGGKTRTTQPAERPERSGGGSGHGRDPRGGTRQISPRAVTVHRRSTCMEGSRCAAVKAMPSGRTGRPNPRPASLDGARCASRRVLHPCTRSCHEDRRGVVDQRRRHPRRDPGHAHRDAPHAARHRFALLPRAGGGPRTMSTVGGFSPLVVVVRPRGWSGWFPRDGHVVPRVGLGEWFHSFPAGGVGEADAVAGGDEDVGVVHEPVDEGGGDGAGHEFVEAGGVQVR